METRDVVFTIAQKPHSTCIAAVYQSQMQTPVWDVEEEDTVFDLDFVSNGAVSRLAYPVPRRPVMGGTVLNLHVSEFELSIVGFRRTAHTQAVLR